MASAWICPAISRAFIGSRSAICSSKRSFTVSATSCCCAPSWMLRSRRLRSSSCALTSRCRDARSSSISRTFRSTRPACEARSRTSRSFDGLIGSFAGIETDSAPRSSPWSRTSTDESADSCGISSPWSETAVGGSLLGRRDPRGPELVPHVQPHDGLASADGVGEDLRHPGEDVLGGVGAADALGELREDLVGRRATPVDDPIGDPPGEPHHRPEQETDRDRARGSRAGWPR